MPIVLYRKQKQVLEFIQNYIEKYGYSPTLGEIADAMGLSSLATVHEHLQALTKKGVIKRYEGAVRGIKLVRPGEDNNPLQGIELPVMGFIAAGQPIMPHTDPGATFSVSPSLINGKKRCYVLQVKGDSMIDEGIFDGDFVVIEEANNATDGDIVVAMLDSGLATLKKFFREDTRIRLEPANATMEPIYATNVRIQGKCVAVIRRFN